MEGGRPAVSAGRPDRGRLALPGAAGGHLRLSVRDTPGDPSPDHDLASAVFGIGYGAVHESLPFAAAVLAGLRGARTPVAAVPAPRLADRLQHLSELHGVGLLTDAEYAALRDRLAAEG